MFKKTKDEIDLIIWKNLLDERKVYDKKLELLNNKIKSLEIFKDKIENPPKFKLGDRVLIKRAYDRTIYTIIQVDHNYLSLEERRLSGEYSHWIYTIMNDEYYKIKERETDIRLL